MSEYDVSRQEVENAAAFLRAFLATTIPNGDFSQGTAAGDIIVDGHAYTVAYLQKQIQLVRDRQSLLTLKNLPEGESVADAADAILDNLFRTRSQGRFARGVALVHLSQRVDALIPRNTRFFRASQLVYYVDSAVDVLISAADLRPNLDPEGRIVDWVAPILLTAARVGTEYNQRAGRFVTVDRFSPYLTYVEHANDFEGGAGVQSTADFIAQSKNAISLRALINARSNDALLGEVFPAIERVLSVGYGDPEMVRDLVREPATGVTLHVGGHTDIYVRVPLQEITERLVVQAPTQRADGKAVIFRDSAPPSGSFVTAGVLPGDVLVVGQGIPESPFEYVIERVRANELEISPRVRFSIATDELPPGITFKYSVGNNYPAFDNKVNVASALTAGTSRTFSQVNRVILAGRPIYRVKRVEIISSLGVLDPYRDPVTGRVPLTERVNSSILSPTLAGDPLRYRVTVDNPAEGQSATAITSVEVSWPQLDLAGETVEITYDTLTGFEAMHAYVVDPRNRPLAANTLVRGFFPVYLSCAVPYRLRLATDAAFDEEAAQAALSAFINAYQALDVIDQSLLATQARALSTDVVAVYPFTVNYELLGPDGSVYRYATEDRVTLFPVAGQSARLLNPTDFGLPAVGYHAALKQRLTLQGVSDRNVRFLAATDAVTFERRF